jgi:hypothetical protein
MDTKLCEKCLDMLKIVNEEDPGSQIGKEWDDSFGWNQIPIFQRLCHSQISDIESTASSCTLCSKLYAWIVKHGSKGRYQGLDFKAQPNVGSGVWKFRFDVSEGDGNSVVGSFCLHRKLAHF